MSVVPEGEVRQPVDPDARYTANRGPRFELVREELDIAEALYAAAEERTSPSASPAEKDAAMKELLNENPEFAALWERLQELMAANDESVILALAVIADEEAEEEDAEG